MSHATAVAPARLSTAGAYGRLVLLSLALAGLMAAGLSVLGSFDGPHVIRLRNFLGYGHFALAYIFAWRLVRREAGSVQAAWRYVAVFLAIVAGYCALQRWVLPSWANVLFLTALFMTHHASNEQLFRQQSRTGYRPVVWSGRASLWVALAIGVVLVDFLADAGHAWHAGLPPLLALWAAGWVWYGWRAILPAPAPAALLGWAAAGLFCGWCAARPFGEATFVVSDTYAWFVIYHYVIWYVFYSQKLLYRCGGWRGPRPSGAGPAGWWRYATTVPAGFLALVVAGNAVIFLFLQSADPLARWVTDATQLNFFHVNTFAHILFGVGAPRRRAAAQAQPVQAAAEPLPQFA